MGKTKLLTNRVRYCPAAVACCGGAIKVVGAGETERYLGRKLSATDFHSVEFADRLASGWAVFFKLKQVLCNRKVALRDRLKLFQCTVTPYVLYACGSWTTTVEMEHKLKTTRRRMLRWMVGVPRQPEEEWPDYVQRATHRCEELASIHSATDWLTLQRRYKWRLAGKAAVSTDGRWPNRLLAWRPWFRTIPYRDVGRPVKRWEDDLTALAGGGWAETAQDSEMWTLLGEGFVNGF